jgi:pyruvate dehydrogenase E2 component (dihydrolipoamide acetyltransferase)
MRLPNYFWGTDMALELTMPALSPTMEKGTLANWLVAVGDDIKAGDIIAEIETDKATMEFEALEDGRIAELLVSAGTEDVAVGTVIALVGETGDESISAQKADDSGQLAQESALESCSTEIVEPAKHSAASLSNRSSETVLIEQARPIDEIANATPLAKRIAVMRGIDLGAINGSGPRGRIVKADLGIEPLVVPAEDVSPSLSISLAPPPEGVPRENIKLGSMRKTIARRLTESKTTVPHFYLTARCSLDALLSLRSELNRTLEQSGIKLSVNDFLMKAQALALRQVPDANVQYGGDVLYRFERVDISMAVAIEGGLVTPVLRDVASMSLSAIAAQSKALAVKAREGKLAPEDYTGGTASISNLGMFGIDEMFPVLNPPQALILGVAAGVRQPWDVEGNIALATIMAATASFDHRAIDGATGAQFMKAFRALIEEPMRLLV